LTIYLGVHFAYLSWSWSYTCPIYLGVTPCLFILFTRCISSLEIHLACLSCLHVAYLAWSYTLTIYLGATPCLSILELHLAYLSYGYNFTILGLNFAYSHIYVSGLPPVKYYFPIFLMSYTELNSLKLAEQVLPITTDGSNNNTSPQVHETFALHKYWHMCVRFRNCSIHICP
jgi:hypothetical protein